MTLHNKEKKYLSRKGVLDTIKSAFKNISSKKRPHGSVLDSLMSALAMFSLKMPSLLQFNNHRNDETIKHNLTTLFGVREAPADTSMRECLDPVDPRELRPAFTDVFRSLQRGKILQDYIFLDQYYLLSVDGTGVFSSPTIHCDCCCIKKHQDGSTTYYHQIVTGAIVHPDNKEVFPICPEPIIKQDGKDKNDCETNACHRLLADFRNEHGRLNIIVLGDAIHATGPRLRQLINDRMSYIIGVKPGSHESLFEWITGVPLDKHECVIDGLRYIFRWVDKVPLNDANPDLLVNFLECVIENPKKGKTCFTWITNLKITKSNVYEISRGGRAKWKIENETFNTLKNQGYHFEHNYGHGKQNLSTVFTLLMMLAFLMDQVQQRACGMFQAALKKTQTKIALWEKIRSLFTEYFVMDWEDLFHAIATGQGRAHLPKKHPP